MRSGPVVEELEYAVSAPEAAAVRAYSGAIGWGLPGGRILALYIGSSILNLGGMWLQAAWHGPGSAYTIAASIFTVMYALLIAGWFVRCNAARLVPAADVAAKLRVSAAGLNLRFGARAYDVPWRAVERVVALDGAFVFVSRSVWSMHPTVVLPRRVLAPGEAERLWNFIDAQLTAKAGLVRGVEYARPTIFNTLAR